MEDQRINNLPPFKNGKIFAFDSDGLFSRPTLRILEGAKKLRESILKKNN
jgi:ABC-type Fe3+-hydroxamate transport system substrate-binding protein